MDPVRAVTFAEAFVGPAHRILGRPLAGRARWPGPSSLRLSAGVRPLPVSPPEGGGHVGSSLRRLRADPLALLSQQAVLASQRTRRNLAAGLVHGK